MMTSRPNRERRWCTRYQVYEESGKTLQIDQERRWFLEKDSEGLERVAQNPEVVKQGDNPQGLDTLRIILTTKRREYSC